MEGLAVHERTVEIEQYCLNHLGGGFHMSVYIPGATCYTLFPGSSAS